MKKITLNYNDKGYISNTYDDGEFYIAQQEDKAVIISATFPANLVGSVNAYVKSGSGGDVVENCGTIDINKHTVEFALDSKYLAYNYLKVGFEVETSTKEIRFEPLTLEVDEFVNVTGSSTPSPYTVSVKVGNVTQLEPDAEPTITNTGTETHLVLNFGMPRGETGLKGDKGDKGDKGETGAQGIQGIKGDKGDKGEQGIPGKDGADGYTPVKGVDYFTDEDIKGLGIDDKVDKEDGKGLSTNDFTDEHKDKLKPINYIELNDDWHVQNPDRILDLLNEGNYKWGINFIASSEFGDFVHANQYGILIASNGEAIRAIYISTYGKFISFKYDHWDNTWYSEGEPYATQYDLNNAIGNVETSLENIIEKYGLGGDSV